MDRIEGMRAFLAVADTGSFSAGARRLGLARALVSKRIAALEDNLGTRLLNRTTRRLSLSGPGTHFLERCRRIVAEVDEAAAELRHLQVEPSGRLKISAPMSFGVHHLAPLLPAFMAENPKLEVELNLNDRFVDLVDEGFDVAVRIGELKDSSLIARRLAPVCRALYASPDYVARTGEPSQPRDLESHEGLHYENGGVLSDWRLQRRDDAREVVTVSVPTRIIGNNGDVLLAAAVSGLGITSLPTFFITKEIRSAKIVRILPNWEPSPLTLHALWPANRLLPRKVRRFVDFLANRFGDRPYWDDPDRPVEARVPRQAG